MSYSGYDRYLAVIYRSRKILIIECPKILHRAASSADYQYISDSLIRKKAHSSSKLSGSLFSLYQNRSENDLSYGKSSADYLHDISQSRSRRRSYDADGLRHSRYRLFMLSSKKPL